jgi:hypothetical protein
MFRPQRVIFRCYKHVVLKLHHKSLTFSSLALNCWNTYLHLQVRLTNLKVKSVTILLTSFKFLNNFNNANRALPMRKN